MGNGRRVRGREMSARKGKATRISCSDRRKGRQQEYEVYVHSKYAVVVIVHANPLKKSEI